VLYPFLLIYFLHAVLVVCCVFSIKLPTRWDFSNGRQDIMRGVVRLVRLAVLPDEEESRGMKGIDRDCYTG